MKTILYCYSDPLLESSPNPNLSSAQAWADVLTQQGWEIEQIYADLASSPPTDERPQLQQLLAAAGQAAPDRLLLRRLDELGETLASVTQRLSAIEALGMAVITIESPDRAADDPRDRSQVKLLQVADEIQAAQRQRRIRQGHARNRLKGLAPPGKAPYGYRRSQGHYVLDRGSATIVKAFFEHYLLYGSLRAAVRHIAQRYSKQIAVSTGQRWLENPVYRGDTAYSDGLIHNTHAALLSREEAAQIDRLRRRNRQFSSRTASVAYSLAGLVVCQSCRSSFRVNQVTQPRQSQSYLYLRPVACPRQPKCGAIAYSTVLQQTIGAICAQLPQAVAQIAAAPMAGIKASLLERLQQQQAVLAQLPELVSNNILDAQTAELRAYRLQTEIATVRQKLAQLPPVNLQETAQTASIPQFWFDLSESERRFFFREFIREVQLSPADEGGSLSLMFIF
ncbi:recombinase family protein [Romeria aff. gracilis LEGE 07310]|uniref:Recombinase family protein n=1 Tax=Vasconcelosia minhoensis LEGE 07310 TaxID=915328 RepID=A0A8J7AGW8_9CYAN|nr:recombinase family protein [Romeria gracilis]MBE9078704.1 recombinase family protein [Romeria aff. gracilis LEGE 07310]